MTTITMIVMQIMDEYLVEYGGMPMHAECFRCGYCDQPLVSGGVAKEFKEENNTPFCADCYGLLFAHRCMRCQKPITGTRQILRQNVARPATQCLVHSCNKR